MTPAPKVGQIWSFYPHAAHASPFKLRIEYVGAEGVEVSDPDLPGSLKRVGFSSELWRVMIDLENAEIEVSEPS